MVRDIIQIGDPILLEVSKKVTKKDLLSRETQVLIDDMLDTCNAEKEGSAGLSAVQIGVLKRIYIARRMDLQDGDDDRNPIWEVMVNPVVEVLDDTGSRMWEGCLSIGKGDERLFAPVSRPKKIRVTYWDREGKEKSFEASEYMSHVVQHEQDHLDGKLFLNYVKNPKNIWKSIDLDKYINTYGEYPSS